MKSNEEIVREAYRLAEGNVLDGPGFRALFTEDGTFNDVPNSQTFRGDEIPRALTGLAGAADDITLAELAGTRHVSKLTLLTIWSITC